MKKVGCCFCIFFSLCLLSFAQLVEIYKKGEINIIPSPEFTINTDWGAMFRMSDEGFAFLPDGSFFRSASREHKIYKFNQNGEILFEFGKEGQGPGDLTHPASLSILDNQYLIVLEGGEFRRLSVFDLNGKFVKLIKTEGFAVSCAAIGQNKVGLVLQLLSHENDKVIKVFEASILDIITGEKNIISEYNEEYLTTKMHISELEGKTQVVRVDGNRLVVGFTNSLEIKILNSDGIEVSKFKLPFEREKATKNFINNYLNRAVENESTPARQERLRRYIEKEWNNFEFPGYFPYYDELAVDSENNILVYKKDRANESDIFFHVYSSEGNPICRTKINFGSVRPFYPKVFFKNSIYAPIKYENGDGSVVFAKIELKHSSN